MKTSDELYWVPSVSERWGMTEVRCMAGQPVNPTKCNRHLTHHWCDVCEGYYGVPHDGPEAHSTKWRRDCVCRPCRELNAHGKTGDARRDALTSRGSCYHPEFPPPSVLR